MANDLSAFNSEAWSSRLVAKLDQVNVMLQLVNRNWEGDLRQNKTVWVRTPGSISMRSYTRGTTITYEDLTPSKESFTVNDGEYFAFEVDDIDRAQSDLSAMDIYTKRAVVALNNVVEAKILATASQVPVANQISGAPAGTGAVLTAVLTAGVVTSVTITAAGTGYTTAPLLGFQTDPAGGGAGAAATCTVSGGNIATVTVTSGGHGYNIVPAVVIHGAGAITLDSSTSTTTGIYSLFCQAGAILSNNNVPATGRWAVIDPDTEAILQQDVNHFVRAGELGDRVVQYGIVATGMDPRTALSAPGYVGRIAGFDVFATPHLLKTGSVGNGTKTLLFGDNDAISYAAQITEIEVLRLQTTFANAVRGLMLHDTFIPAESARRLVSIIAAR